MIVMIRLAMCLVMACLSLFLYGQEPVTYELAPNHYPEGIYPTFDSFLDIKPSKRRAKVEARDLFKPKTKILDPFIDNCYFYDQRTNKRIKDVFAISHAGSLYINVKSLHKLLGDKKDRKHKVNYKDSYFRVLEQGKYMYLEGYFSKGGGIGFSVGGGPISIGTGGPREELLGIVFDFEKEEFDLFRDCKDFNRFLALDYRDKGFECDRKNAPIEVIHDIIYEINLEADRP